MAKQPDASNWYLTPKDKKRFAEWLLSLKDDDLVCDKFNGYMYDKTYKLISDLYNEWFYNVRLEIQKKDIEKSRK